MSARQSRDKARSPATMPFTRYRPYPEVELAERSWPDQRLEKAPLWCSVDLRDGNQALVDPMDIERKQRMYDHLVIMGFKEIEIGFPAASQIDFDFCRKIIEDDAIPEDITIQVLTQARDDLIERTFEAIKGAPRAILHLYNSTSTTQRRVVFRTDKAGIIKIAVHGAEQCLRGLEAARLADTEDIRFEYSPESYTGTEPEFALEVCETVKEVFKPTPPWPLILNLPATVEMSSPNLYADMIERFHCGISERASTILSLHPHNDRGTAVAAAELGLMAGADRVEGTLFGNGERTGNVDLVTLALNLLTQGVDPELDISDIETSRRIFEYANRMQVPARHPYVGELVYTAFSGSHQDAIKKGMAALYDIAPGMPLEGDYDVWDVPYLPIDPKHLGRSYEAVVRINSQSGKGGIAYVLLHEYGLDLPRKLQIDFSGKIQAVTEDCGGDISSYEIHRRFRSSYMESDDSQLRLLGHRSSSDNEAMACTHIKARLHVNGEERTIEGSGNGPIDAFVAALRSEGLFPGRIIDYHEHAIGSGSDAAAAAYIAAETDNGRVVWGVAAHPSIVSASLQAIISAADRMRQGNHCS